MTDPGVQQIQRLASMGRWWEVAAAAQAYANVPEPDVWLAQAIAWRRLGLGRLARVTLDRLCGAFPQAENRPDICGLRDEISALPDERIPHELLTERGERAGAALAERGVGLGDAVARWRASLAGVEVYATSDGNIVRRRADGQLELVGDHRAAAQSLIEQHRASLGSSPAPILVEGLDPPWLALGILEATHGEGYTPGIRLVQGDPVELLDGLSLADVTELIRAPRVEWFVGEHAPNRLAHAIAGEPGVMHEGPSVPLATLRTRLGPSLGEAIRGATAEHAQSHADCLDQIRSRDASASDDERLARLSSARSDRPRRVVLIAGRFTTVLKPMVDDLSDALGQLGCETRIISEPSDHRRLSPLAYSRVFAEFDPDLVVCANHTRDDADRLLGERVMPRSVPWVTWAQDSMPNLMRPEAAESTGPLDLVMGHVTQAMSRDLGFREERLLRMPMVASERKFSPDRVDRELARELACDVAAVTKSPARRRRRRSSSTSRIVSPRSPSARPRRCGRFTSAARSSMRPPPTLTPRRMPCSCRTWRFGSSIGSGGTGP